MISVSTLSELDTVTSKHPQVLVKFSATWCGPCKAVAPIVDDLDSQFPTIKFVNVDLDDGPAVAGKFAITAVPTFVLLNRGTEVERVNADMQQLSSALRKLKAMSHSLSGDVGKGNRVGGSERPVEPPSSAAIREIRARRLAEHLKGAHINENAPGDSKKTRYPSGSEKQRVQQPSSRCNSSATLESWTQSINQLCRYVYLYGATLLSLDARGKARQIVP